MTHLISEIVGEKGCYPLINRFYELSKIVSYSELSDILEEISVSEDVFEKLRNFGIFIENPSGFFLSTFGQKTSLLLRAINEDEEISEVVRKLTDMYPSLKPYELITESVTDYFINTLYNKQDFIRVLICSPWIRLSQSYLDMFKDAVYGASILYSNLQISIITLPLKMYSSKSAIQTINELKNFGAEIMFNDRLHAKLYMCEPGPLGGSHYAIFGSENLTGAGHIELAIKIENDNEILRKLNTFFYDIRTQSQIL